MESRRIRRLALIILVVLGIVGFVVYAWIPSPVPVEISRVVRGPLRVMIDQQGETRAHDRFIVSSPILGRLLRVQLDDGDAVRKGAIVARIEPVPLTQREREEIHARVEAAEAALRQAKSREARAREDAAQARRERDRAERLAKGGVLSTQLLEQAQNADRTASEELHTSEYGVEVAASDLKAAQAGLVSLDSGAGTPRPLVELHAPISGRVLRVLEKSERVVPPGTSIMVLGMPEKIEVVADVLSTDAVQIQPGDPVLLVGWGGDHPLRARVRLVEPYGFTKVSALGVEEQRVNVISDFVDPPGRLGDGYRVDCEIVIWSAPDVLKAPLGSIFRRGQGWSTFAVEGDRARIRDVQIGHRNETEVEILKGLTEGTELIVYPSNEVRDGIRVRRE